MEWMNTGRNFWEFLFFDHWRCRFYIYSSLFFTFSKNFSLKWAMFPPKKPLIKFFLFLSRKSSPSFSSYFISLSTFFRKNSLFNISSLSCFVLREYFSSSSFLFPRNLSLFWNYSGKLKTKSQEELIGQYSFSFHFSPL